MFRRWHIPEFTWVWAWHVFTRATGLDLDARSLSASERWNVIATAVPALVRSRVLRPVRLWLLARTPTRIVLLRLQRSVHGWHRTPNRSASEQVRLRFDIWPLETGDFVQVKDGRLTAIGRMTATFCEIIYISPNGELEADPKSPEMTKAWAAYQADRRSR